MSDKNVIWLMFFLKILLIKTKRKKKKKDYLLNGAIFNKG